MPTWCTTAAIIGHLRTRPDPRQMMRDSATFIAPAYLNVGESLVRERLKPSSEQVRDGVARVGRAIARMQA